MACWRTALVSAVLFFLLTPGLFFTLLRKSDSSRGKWKLAAAHALLFAAAFYGYLQMFRQPMWARTFEGLTNGPANVTSDGTGSADATAIAANTKKENSTASAAPVNGLTTPK